MIQPIFDNRRLPCETSSRRKRGNLVNTDERKADSVFSPSVLGRADRSVRPIQIAGRRRRLEPLPGNPEFRFAVHSRRNQLLVIFDMSALFNFHSFLTVVLLVICTCTYVKMHFPAILEQRTGFHGFFWKAARIGERLSPWVAIGCFSIGVSIIFF